MCTCQEDQARARLRMDGMDIMDFVCVICLINLFSKTVIPRY